MNPPAPPTIDQIMGTTDWRKLSRQKLALLAAIETAERLDRTRQAEELTGILHWIDDIQDVYDHPPLLQSSRK